MANSRFGYVRQAELDDRLLPNTFAVIRLDGKGFTKFSTLHGFEKPNDLRALNLMNQAAIQVLQSDLGRGYSVSKSKKKSSNKKSSTGIILAYGQSDEFSFAFGRNCQAYNRRASKLLTTVLSTFTAAYIHLWPHFFPQNPLSIDSLPTFDGRIIQYATDQELQDYFKWRQVDAHINNLYNTTFWALVNQGNRTTQEAHKDLKGTFSKDKHSILFERFQINYNNEPELFKRGSILLWPLSQQNPEPPDLSSSAHVANQDPDLASNKLEESCTADVNVSISATSGADKGKISAQPLRGGDNRLETVCIIHDDLVKDQWWTFGRGSQILA